MKLKNSHILLIVMSIFLLVSIGSVCANDTVADADIISDDAGDVALSDGTSKIPTTVDAKNATAKNTENAKIATTVKDNSSKAVNITADDLTVTEGNASHDFTYEKSNIILKNKLTNGNHSLVINYKGNDQYASSSTSILLKITGNYTIEAPANVDVNSTRKTVIPINVTGAEPSSVIKDNFKLTLSYTDGNDTISKNVTSFNVKDGKITFDFNYDTSKANLTIAYDDGSNKASKIITIKQIVNAKLTVVETTAEYASGKFQFKITDIDNNNAPIIDQKISMTLITGSINTGLSAITDDDGIASFDNTNMMYYTMQNGTIVVNYHIPVGKQAVTVKPDGDIVKFDELKTNLTITKATVNIKANSIKADYHSNKNFTILVTNKKTGEPMKNIVLKLDMPQTNAKTYYLYTDVNGTARIAVGNLSGGVYNVTVSINETKNINKKSIDRTITINPEKAKISTKSYKVSYNTGATATIKLTDEKTGKALSGIYILVQLYTGKKHDDYVFQTNKYGKVKFSAPLAVGKHKMVVSTADTRYTAPSVTKQITVKKATGKFSAPKVKAYYKEGKSFIVKLVNTKKNKQPIYGANINLKVFVTKTQYYAYNGQTGADGKLRLTIDLNPGTYKVEVSTDDTKNFTAKKITSKITVKKTSAKITAKKLTAKKGESKKLKINVTNKKNKKAVVGVKVKVKVYTGSKSKTYTLKTNSKGIAKLNTKSLSVGSHKVVIKSADKYCSASKAKSTIKITK